LLEKSQDTVSNQQIKKGAHLTMSTSTYLV